MSHNARPVTIRGVDYPSIAAASRALGVRREAVDKAIAAGRLEFCGLGRGIPDPMPITIRGVAYPSARAAAQALGVKPSAIYQALHVGDIDRVGRPRRRGGFRSKPFEIAGLTWPSLRSASLDLGFTSTFISAARRRNHRRGLERIMAAAMRLKAEREREAS